MSMGEAHRLITDYITRISDAVISEDEESLTPLLSVSSSSYLLVSLADALSVFQVYKTLIMSDDSMKNVFFFVLMF